MTTPAHCTRTDPHFPHEDRSDLDIRMPTRCDGIKPCGHTYQRPGGNQRGDRIVECDLPADHTSHHQETATDSVWPLFPWEHAKRSGVEPPADVAATPDPRLDVIDPVIRELWQAGTVEHALTWGQRILDALDDLAAAQTMNEPDITDPAAWASGSYHRADQCPTIHDMEDCHTRVAANLGCAAAQTMHEPNDRMQDGPCGVMPTYHVDELFSAPAGLTPAQEIRLRLVEHEHNTVNLENGYLDSVAAWVEHGPDETPDSTPMTPTFADLQRRLGYVRDDLNSMRVRALAAEARADLAEARLGHIADALRDANLSSLVPTGPVAERTILFIEAVRDALAWTPDDTATPSIFDEVCPRCGQPAYRPSIQGIPAAHGEGFCVPTATPGADTTGDE